LSLSPLKPYPCPSLQWGEGHLAVSVLADGAFAACLIFLKRLSLAAEVLSARRKDGIGGERN